MAKVPPSSRKKPTNNRPDGKIVACKISPGIGIARLGNSPNAFFIGPEAPGHFPDPLGGFKDDKGRIKRQAARFRIYGYDAQGNVVKELTTDDAVIVWNAQLANKKASYKKFAGKYHPDQPLRNDYLKGAKAREVLNIEPGAREISGANQKGATYHFDSGTFGPLPLPDGKGESPQVKVPLGELRTDDKGRLLVLGGAGHSESVIPDNPIGATDKVNYYANNDYWHDDASDGPVNATVTLKADGRSLPVTGSWVIVAPPKFAPAHVNIVSLYDVAKDVAIKQKWLPADEGVSFTKDIYPLLYRATQYQWLNGMAYRGHGPRKPGDLLSPDSLKTLADKSAASAPARLGVFKILRTPNILAVEQANYSFMPLLSGDDGDATVGKPKTWLTVLESQYEKARKWAEGKFIDDWTGAPPTPPTFAEIAVTEQPSALDCAALEPCIGGPFYPGIEMTYISADADTYSAPFRISLSYKAGDVTKYMAEPWQADFFECNTHWWPTARPDDVVPESEYQRILAALVPGELADANEDESDVPEPTVESLEDMLAERVAWGRGIPVDSPAGDNAMVKAWSHMGFVVPKPVPDADTVFVEIDRDPYFGLDQRQYFHMLLNIDSYNDFLPRARRLAEQFLEQAWALQSTTDLPDTLRYFPYSEDAFEARLNQIYNDLVHDANVYNPADDPVFKSRDDVVQRVLQFAPFNQLDGAWLRNVTQTGPISQVHSLLFGVWMDEVGDGMVGRNHCNVYTDLLHSVEIYLPDVNTQAYVQNPALLDSAFTTGLFELAISQFSESFFPELLGMTLQLEWEVVGLKPTIDLFNYYGVDPHFYVMHVGIDNAAAGHGAKAKQAVEIYLDEVREAGGDEAVQAAWKRIWNGYVAFATTGNIGSDLTDLLQNPPTPEDRMVDMINQKKPYASLNHGKARLGPNRINDWFEDPEGFLNELVKAGLIIPGHPETSPFFKLLNFDGPMYKVFTDDEVLLWVEWVMSLDSVKPMPPIPPKLAMVKLIDTLRNQQMGEVAHQVTNLKGPDPNDPNNTIEKPVSWWFTQSAPLLMSALSNERNGIIVKGNPDQSIFITQLLAPSNTMGQAFAGAASPDTGYATWFDIAVAWIKTGCQLPEVQEGKVPRVMLASSEALHDPAASKKIWGMGAVH
ncbi:MAG: iron-containing redox enzyme family protein [Acidobacteria bacterium]|nr:iron-containing redox enzyme family protein [Acidobacteriota bacterium]